MNKIARSSRREDVLSLQLARDRVRGGSNPHVSLAVSNSETTEFGNQRRLERLEAENTQLRGMWSIFCSSFKRCAMMPDSSCRQTLAECAQTIRVRVGGCGVKNSDHASEFFILSQSGVRYFFSCFAVSYGLGECGQVKLAVIE
jgi:hypothetical protein